MKKLIGFELIDSVALDDRRLNYLFSLLISSIIWVFIGGNFVVRSEAAFIASLQVTAACLGVVLLIYMVSRCLGSLIWGIALTYSAIWMSVYTGQYGQHALYILIAASSIYSLRNLRLRSDIWIAVLISGLIGALTVLFVERAYTSFDIAERVMGGVVHRDTLFHASIAAMIKNYGVTSTGLNGLVPISYHVLSHVIFAAISLLSGASVLNAYGVATWILFAPLLIFSIVGAIAMLDREGVLDISRSWNFTCLALVLFPYFFSRWVLLDSYFVSESYLVALGIFVLALPLLQRRELSSLDVLLTLLTGALMTYAKGSVGVIYFGIWFARLLFVQDCKKAWSLACLVASGLSVYIVAHESANAAIGEALELSWFHYITYYSAYGACIADACSPFVKHSSIFTYLYFAVILLGFFMLHFAPSFLLFVITFIKFNFRTAIKSPVIIYAGASTLAGILITSIMVLPGGGVYYFSNIAMFVALPTLIAFFVRCSQLCLNERTLNFIVILSIFSIKFPIALENVSLPRQYSKNKLIEALTTMRASASKHHVYLLKERSNIDNPISPCWAQPFLYPALSERAWSGLIVSMSECSYFYYGYGSYNIPLSDDKKMPPPVLRQALTLKKKRIGQDD